MKLKIIYIILIIFLLVFFITSNVYAINFNDAKNFVNKGKTEAELKQTDLDEIGKQFSHIAQILVFIGAGVVVGATAYMGILYMTASPEKQGKLKEQLIGLAVSAIVIFGAYFIWSTVYNILNDAFK